MRDLFEQIYRPCRLAQAADSTVQHYRLYLRALERYLTRPPEVTDFREETIAPFLTDYATTHAPHTVQSIRKDLLALWRFCASRIAGVSSPDLGVFRVPQTNPEAWSPAELARLLAAARRFRPRLLGYRTYCGVRPNLWWCSFLYLLYDTGFRRSAAMELCWPDINLEQGWALAKAAHQKTERDEVRTLAPDTTAALSVIRFPERLKVFPFAGHLVTFYHHYDCVLKAAGLPTGRTNKAQRMRRTHATWLAHEAGQTAAQESLGHSSLRLTQRHYLDARYVRPLDAARLLPRPKL